jgi:hypothetical protein
VWFIFPHSEDAAFAARLVRLGGGDVDDFSERLSPEGNGNFFPMSNLIENLSGLNPKFFVEISITSPVYPPKRTLQSRCTLLSILLGSVTLPH